MQIYRPCWVTKIFVTLEFDFNVNLFGQQANDENNFFCNYVYIITQNRSKPNFKNARFTVCFILTKQAY